MVRKQRSKNQPYVNIFDDMGADWEAITNTRDTENEADFIKNALATKGIVLDLCCGTARHSIALSKRALNVVGVDVSRNLLAIASTRVKQAGVKLPLVRADMRFFPFRDGVFCAVISMFTSFGYLPSESEDALGLLEINRTLKRRGKFLLDLANRDHIVRTFRERDWAEFEPFYMLERRSLDLRGSKLTSQWALVRKNTGKVESVEHNVRLYSFVRIEQLLNDAGLAIRNVYGGYEKQEFTLDTSRMITVAEKLG